MTRKSGKFVGASALVFGGLAALFSATGAPVAGTLQALAAAGLSPELGALALHAAPVALAALALPAMQALARGRSLGVRAAIYACGGALVGGFTAACLDLFVGFLPAVQRLTGPLSEAGVVDVLAWGLAALSLVIGAFMAAFAIFGAPAVRAISLEPPDPESTDVRGAERSQFGASAVGLIGQGVFVGALALVHQGEVAGFAVRLGVAGAVVIGALAFVWSSWALWREFDELQRKAVVEAYAWSGLLAWLGILVWAILESLGIWPPMTAYAAIVALCTLQTVAAMSVSAGKGLAGEAIRA